MTILTRQSETELVGRPGRFARRSRHVNRDSSWSIICTNGDHRCDQCDESSQTAVSIRKMEVRKYRSILDITSILARITRRPTGRIPDLRKAYPTYFDPLNLMVRSISLNNNHNMFNCINKILNFKLKLNTHRASDRGNS